MGAVGAATHLVLWLRRYVRGEKGRRRAVVKFASLVLVLQVAAFACGNIMYPTYKAEVRLAFLEDKLAVAAEAELHARELDRLAAREGAEPVVREDPRETVKRAAHAARYFDMKEHWIALGIFAQAALLLVLALWDPHRDGRGIAPIAFGLALVVAASVWFGAIVGVLTAAWRAV